MPVDTVDNSIAYHNFSFPAIRVSSSAFLFVACSNSFHGVYVLRAVIVANNPTFAWVIFICYILGSSF